MIGHGSKDVAFNSTAQARVGGWTTPVDLPMAAKSPYPANGPANEIDNQVECLGGAANFPEEQCVETRRIPREIHQEWHCY